MIAAVSSVSQSVIISRRHILLGSNNKPWNWGICCVLIYYYGRNQAKYCSILLLIAIIRVVGSFWTLSFIILSYLYNIYNPLESSVFQVFAKVIQKAKPLLLWRVLDSQKISGSWILNVWFEAYYILHFISLYLLVMKFLFQ